MIYLSYFCDSRLFLVLQGKDGFDSTVAAALSARKQVTVLVLNGQYPDPDSAAGKERELNRVETVIRIVCISDGIVPGEYLEAVKQDALIFLSGIGKIAIKEPAAGRVRARRDNSAASGVRTSPADL